VSSAVLRELSKVLRQIDRPGSFCVSGSVPAVLPGLEVEGLGPVGLPLTSGQANELKKLCEQAPYGKGEETVVDTSVRRVWLLKPDRFALKGPDWGPFLQQTVRKVQQELGLERQKLESHLYDLLLYEPGSFFLPHRDGEKLDRMVATLVLTLPSSFQGGEPVVRHEGQEQTIDCGGGAGDRFRIHFAAFYADCEHEVRPLRAGHRLCLVYNLTLAKSKKRIAAPRSREHVENLTRLLRDWAQGEAARKLAVTLEHQYTQEGLTWDALKGADRAKAQALLEAARQAGCQAHLALLTLHESGSAEYAGEYRPRSRRGRWGGWDDEEGDASDYEMGEVFETSLTAEHWTDGRGDRLPIGPMNVARDDLLDPESLEDVDPEVEFEGYTGNAGMTLDRWYRHAAIFLWPNRRHFDILCDVGSRDAVQALKVLVGRWRQAGRPEVAALRAECVDFAATIIARWRENAYAGWSSQEKQPCALLESLVPLDEPSLIKAYLGEVLVKDVAVDPGKMLLEVCQKHGWGAFQPELEVVFNRTTGETIERNVRLLELLALAKPRKKEGWLGLCAALAQASAQALEAIDRETATVDYRARNVKREGVLAGLARSLLATEQFELLSRVVAHALARPKKYPLLAHVSALTALQPWLKKNLKRACPSLSQWIAACCEQLEALTARAPQAPTDFRRSAAISCKCSDCGELKRFLEGPHERVHRFRVKEDRRQHLQHVSRQHNCDLDLTTERHGSPYTLVCAKNTASYQAQLKTFHRDQEHLATLCSIQANLPK
jgi:hypothetical protein